MVALLSVSDVETARPHADKLLAMDWHPTESHESFLQLAREHGLWPKEDR